jgi:molybdenum cofactor cytidylyltransferase
MSETPDQASVTSSHDSYRTPSLSAGSWTLPEAFGVQPKDVISFVGGGGKTVAMFRLAAALVERGWRVISTTTTHLGRDEASLAPRHWWSQDSPLLSDALLVELEVRRHLLVTGPPIEAGERWAGVTPGWVAEVIHHPLVDAVLVEADGARDLPFKAPASHEPVVPPVTTLLVPVVGVDAVGRALADVAHRPEQVCALTGLAPEDHLNPRTIASVIAHPAGGLKGRPPDARVRVLVNKVESKERLGAAREIAHHLLNPSTESELLEVPPCPDERSRMESSMAVLIAAMQSQPPIREVRRRVAGIVLAAGCSTRMTGKTPKQLLPWRDSTVVRQVVETLSHCPLSPLLVVLGHRAEEIRPVLAGTRAHSVRNPDYATGEMLSSLQVAICHLDDTVSGCLVFLVDQPWIQASLVEIMLDAYAGSPAGLVAPVYHGRRGHPVLIDRRHWVELLNLEAGLAPRHLLQRYPADLKLVPVETDSILDDMDTIEAYRKARQKHDAHHR